MRSVDVDTPGRKGAYRDPPTYLPDGREMPPFFPPHATVDGYSAFKELWATPEGRIFWQLGNWHGFYKCEPLIAGSDKVDHVPAHAVQIMKDGEWLIALPVAGDGMPK